MAKLLPKKILDEEIVQKLIKYYKLNSRDFDSSDLIEWECFSHPSLELHDCNYRTLLPGRHKCESCKHIAYRPCTISCDIQNFCLAVYAWRMGVGGEDFDAALKHNLYKLKPAELYDEVVKKFSLEELEEVTVLEEPKIPTKKTTKFEKVATVSTDKSIEAVETLTVKEAASYYGCTYANIYNYVKAERIPSHKDGDKTKIKKTDLDKFKSGLNKKRNIRKEA